MTRIREKEQPSKYEDEDVLSRKSKLTYSFGMKTKKEKSIKQAIEWQTMNFRTMEFLYSSFGLECYPYANDECVIWSIFRNVFMMLV